MTENSKHNQAQILISSVYYIERYNPRFDNVINVAQRSITLERTANEASRHERERDRAAAGQTEPDTCIHSHYVPANY